MASRIPAQLAASHKIHHRSHVGSSCNLHHSFLSWSRSLFLQNAVVSSAASLSLASFSSSSSGRSKQASDCTSNTSGHSHRKEISESLKEISESLKEISACRSCCRRSRKSWYGAMARLFARQGKARQGRLSAVAP
ncbi:hypothetical protein Ancab_028161 [Ancistrocladus abbreviatus]